MSDRDPTWTGADASGLTNSTAWRQPEGRLTFRIEPALTIADNIAFGLFEPVDTVRNAFLTVDLTAGNLYHFWANTAQNMPGTPTLRIFDSEGYLLRFVDGDELTPGSDGDDTDSLVLFEPLVTGTYYLNIQFSTWPFASGFSVEAWEDVYGDFWNARSPGAASVQIDPGLQTLPEGDFGLTRFTFTVTRSGDLSGAQSVYWFAAGTGDRPLDDSEFSGGVAPGGVINFAPGQATATITVDVRGDTVAEYAEAFLVRLFAPSPGLRIASGLGIAKGTVSDDDSGVSIEAASLIATEGTGTGGTFTFTVRANAPGEGPHSVRWLIETTGLSSAVDGQDFAGGVLPSGFVSFDPGESTKTVTLTFAGDAIPEAAEFFRVKLQAMPGYLPLRGTTSLVVELRDDDVNRVSIAAQAESVVEGTGAGGVATFVVTRSIPTTAQTVDWLASGLSAADFADGTVPGGRLVFAAGEASKTITIRLRGDSEAEEREVLTVSLSAPNGDVVFGTRQASSVIQDDEATVGFHDIFPVREGSAATTTSFTLERIGDFRSEATIAWQVGPHEGWAPSADAADFVGGAWPAGVATFVAGSRFASVTLHVAGDAIPEPDEWFTIRLSDASHGMVIRPHGGTLSGVIATDETFVGDNDPYPSPHVEGDGAPTSMVIRLYRSGDTSVADTLNWAVSANVPGHTGAVATAARFAGGVLPSGRVTFAPGESTQEITLSIASDNLAGPDLAAFRLVLTPARPGLGAETSIIRFIQEDDAVIAIQPNWVQQAEGDDGLTPFIFTVTRSGATLGTSSVAWNIGTAPGATVTGDDFEDGVLPSGVLTFAPGETTATIIVNVRGDREAETIERFFVTLSDPSPDATLGNAIGRGAILPDDTSVSVAALLATRPEGNTGTTPFTFAVTRAGVTDGAQSVDWSVIGAGTRRATASDFGGGVLPTGRVEFAAGEVRKTITIQVAGDTLTEFDEGFAVLLGNPTNGLTIGQAQAVGTILRDETRIGIVADVSAVVEGSGGTTPVTFTVTRSGYTGAAQVVDWSVVSTGPTRALANDFAPATLPRGALRFEAGEDTKTITIRIAADRVAEGNETFTVRLAGRGEGVTLNPPVATVTILDDDTSVAIAPLLAVQAEGDGGTTPFTFTVTRSGVLDAAQSVAWAVGPLGAARATAADFAGGVLPSGIIAFDPGQASALITIDVLADDVAERAEDFVVRLSAPSPGLAIGRAIANGRILDDDGPASTPLALADWVL